MEAFKIATWIFSPEIFQKEILNLNFNLFALKKKNKRKKVQLSICLNMIIQYAVSYMNFISLNSAV